MKRLMGVCMILLLIITGCTEKRHVTEDNKEVNDTKEDKKYIENEKGKFEEISFSEIMGDITEIGTKVYITGSYGTEFLEGDKKTFSFYPDSGFGGYKINDLYKEIKFEHEDKIRVYGTYVGKDNNNEILIDAVLIEKQ